MIVYKCVLIDGTSTFAPKSWERKYKVGKTTLPKRGSLLFAFKTFAAALEWREYCCYEILKCKAVVSKRKPGLIPCGSQSASPEVYQRFWKYGEVPEGNEWDAPAGSVYCESITPIAVSLKHGKRVKR